MGPLQVFFGAVSDATAEGGPIGSWSNLSDVRAFSISVTGFAVVFCGLMILFGFMALMGWFFHGRKVTAAAELLPVPESPARGASGPDSAPEGPPSEVVEVESESVEDEPFVLPETPGHMVPSSLISGAALALHLYEKGGLALGEPRNLEVDGIPRMVTLLAVGFANRARVDGEEIVFSQTRIAPDEAA